MRGRLQVGDQGSFVLCGLTLAGTALALIVLGALGKIHGAALLLLAAGLVGGAGALLGWRRAARVAVQVAAVEDKALDELESEQSLLEREAVEAEHEAEQLASELERERRANATAREWNRKLREQVLKLQRAQGILGSGDVRELVLRTAISLLGAEKGLLLSREDENRDGDLDLVCAIGFEGEPERSPVVQRFARRVLDRDRTLREEHVEDPEIENLVAIPMYLSDSFVGVVVCCNLRDGVHAHDDEVLLALGDHAGTVLHNSRLHGQLRGSYLATVAMLADAIQAKDPFLRGHSDEVSRYVGAVGDRLGLAGDRREELVFGSLLHDVGKIGVSERILLKPAALTPEERSVVELHPRIGCRLVEQVPTLRAIAPAILHHHERFDGEGYPGKLKGEQIPLEARIIAVADSYSAMTAERPYRAAMTVEEACAELKRCAGTQFDPEVVRLFVEQVERDGEPVERGAIEDPELESRRNGNGPLPLGAHGVVDGTTLLYSRRHLHEVAHAEAQRAALQDRPFAVLLVELTELAAANRDRGWAAGDEELRRAARALEETGGKLGGTACRFGGGTLALIVPGADDRTVDHIADEIAGALAEGPEVRIVHAVWQLGDEGDDVVERARRLLAARRARIGS